MSNSFISGSCEFIEQAVADHWQRVVLQLEFWAGGGLTTPHRKNPACYEMLHRASDLDGFFGTT
jgi:hypothetical protein